MSLGGRCAVERLSQKAMLPGSHLKRTVNSGLTASSHRYSSSTRLSRALTLIGCHAVMAHLTWRHPHLARLIDGKPQVLIRTGTVDEQLMRTERLTADDVHAALRAAGCLHTHEVERATIETNGQITVVLRNRVSWRGLPPSAPGAPSERGDDVT